MRYIIKVLKSHYCQLIFLLSFIVSYLLTPKKAFYSYFLIISFIFITLSSLVITCLFRNVKERIILAKNYGKSLIGIIATGVGLTALQACGVGAPICGATISAGVLSLFLPTIFDDFLISYGTPLLLLSIGFQGFSLYLMNCFKIVH